MKAALAITSSLLMAAICYGWFQHHQLSQLKATHHKLCQQTKAMGIHSTASGKRQRTSSAKQNRVLSETETIRLAGNFIAYAEDMERLGKDIHTADKATRQKMIQQMNEIMGLNKKQLLICIHEIQAADQTTPAIREKLLTFLLTRLRSNHPQEALQTLLTSPGLLQQIPRTNDLIGGSIQLWAAQQPQQAIAWLQEHGTLLPEKSLAQFEYNLIYGTASRDFPLALSLFDTFQKSPDRVTGLFHYIDPSHESKMATLTPFRQWLSTLPDDAKKEHIHSKCIVHLALGGGKESAQFETSTYWIQQAKLTRQELEFLTLTDLSYYIRPNEAGQWIEWIGKNIRSESSQRRIQRLTRSHRTSAAVKKWLETAPDGETKEIVIKASNQTN